MNHAQIGNHSTLVTAVNLGGYTTLGEQTDMGIGVATKQFTTIGSNCTISGQAMVVKNVENGHSIKGVPAK